MIVRMFKAAKDAFTSKAAQTFINQRIARYGQVEALKIDSRNKTMEMSCQLTGEPTPVFVRVQNYALRDEVGGKKILKLGSCVCSRPWLENLLNDFATGREIPVPPWAAAAL
jgi:hypothetical protein